MKVQHKISIGGYTRHDRTMCTNIMRKLSGNRHKTLRLLILLTVLCIVLFLLIVEVSKVQRMRNFVQGCPDQSWPQQLPSKQSWSHQLPSKQQVLLVTYGRSGSSFTSALINHHSDVFLIFEPFFVFRKLHLNNYQRESVAILESSMKCDIPLEHAFALNNLPRRLNPDTREMRDCFREEKIGFVHVICFLKFLKECRARKTLFIKVIQFQAKWAETFLENLPNFKLLYLVRDPRPTLFSQAQAFSSFDWSSQIDNSSREHCSLVGNDLAEVERLYKLFPGRVKGIRYEEGATDPIVFTRNIYNFLGLEYNEETERYVKNITRAEATDPGVNSLYEVVRVNSTEAMNKWRTLVDSNSVQKVDRACGFLYSKLGYSFVHSESDLKGDHPLFKVPESEVFLN